MHSAFLRDKLFVVLSGVDAKRFSHKDTRNTSSVSHRFSVANFVLMATKKVQKTCSKGHLFYKSSDCPACPICEKEKAPKDGFLSLLSAPARRALDSQGITTVKKLAQYSEKEILALHGMGKASIPKLAAILKKEKLFFKK